MVLRQHKLGEADRIVTLLTRRYGLVRAVAKGVRRTRSKFGARLEPFAHVDVQLHPGRSLDIVTQVQTLDAFAVGIVDDYSRYTTACAILETAERLAGEERAPAPRLHALTVGALRAAAVECRGLVIGSSPAAPDLAERCNVGDLPAVTGVPLLGSVPEGAAALTSAELARAAPRWLRDVPV